MNKVCHNFSKKTNIICNSQIVDEEKYPFLKTLRVFLEKVSEIKACYLSGPIVQTCVTDLQVMPLIYLYIISDKVTPYIYKYIKDKTSTLIKDFFFPNYIFTEVYIISVDNLDESAKFRLKCDSAFWFGDRTIHDKLPQYHIKDICCCNNNYKTCANKLRVHTHKAQTGKTLWINIYILLNIVIKAIYEKNNNNINAYHCTCTEKHDIISNHPDIPIIDKNIVKESFRIIKNLSKKSGENVTINKPFFNFICNYFDFCNKVKTFQEILEQDFSIYRNWLQFITSEDSKDHELLELENRNDFKFLFQQSNERYLNRITRDQVLMHNLVPPRPKGVNPAGLTPDVMKRLNKK